MSNEDKINKNNLLLTSSHSNSVNFVSEASKTLELGELLGLVVEGNRDSVIQKLEEMDKDDKSRWEKICVDVNVNA